MLNEAAVLDSGARRPIEQILKTLAETDTVKFGSFFRRMRDSFPDDTARACTQYLATHELDALGRELSSWLAQGTKYLSLSFDPSFLTLAEASRVVRTLRVSDPKFFLKFSQLTDERQHPIDLGSLGRALSLIDSIGDYSALIPRLHALTSHPDERIRSKATKALCALRPNRSLLRRQLESDDPRVRANAIEGIWHVGGEDVKSIFTEALADNHHRVVANAVVGLYYLDDKSTFEIFRDLSGRRSPLFRSATAWALGHVRDRRSIPLLRVLAADPNDDVSSRAHRDLEKLFVLFPEERGAVPSPSVDSASAPAAHASETRIEPPAIETESQPAGPPRVTIEIPNFRML